MGGLFSHRHGYGRQREIIIREDAPEGLRMGLVQIGRDLGMNYANLRDVICHVLRRRPDSGNWAEVPNIRDEVNDLISECEWYLVYDIAEGLDHYFAIRNRENEFAQRLNHLFEDDGIGWQIVGGQVVTRGTVEFEYAVTEAVEQLGDANFQTAKRELEEARRDLSERPEPDVTGTIQHCMAALEATARVIAGDPRATFGEILNRYRDTLGIPRPLDTALTQIWGYACEMGRHLREGRNPNRREAELLLGMAATTISYLLRRQ
jgi:hypothetical protein